MSPESAAALGVAAAAGALAGAGFEALAMRLRSRAPARLPGVNVRLRSGGAGGMLAGSAIPVAAAAFVDAPHAVAAGTLLGWLLLGIAIYDERALLIHHAHWIIGTAVALGVAWGAGGAVALAVRAVTALAFAAGLRALAAAARGFRGRAVIGPADYGIAALIGAVCGLEVGVDVVLVAGVVALAHLVRAPRSRAGRLCHGAGTIAAAGAAAFGGAAGAAVAALVLVLVLVLVREQARERAPAAVPFGACMVLGLFIVLLGGAVSPLASGSAIGADVVLNHLLAHSR